jgi:hypothetical protein
MYREYYTNELLTAIQSCLTYPNRSKASFEELADKMSPFLGVIRLCEQERIDGSSDSNVRSHLQPQMNEDCFPLGILLLNDGQCVWTVCLLCFRLRDIVVEICCTASYVHGRIMGIHHWQYLRHSQGLSERESVKHRRL